MIPRITKVVRKPTLAIFLSTVLIGLSLFWGIRVVDAVVPIIMPINNPEPQTNAQFGRGISPIADINGDGIGDLAVGAPGADKVWLFSGADQSVILTISEPDELTGVSFGFSVAGVGDVDGDGIGDVAVGAPALSGDVPVPSVDCLLDPDNPLCDVPYGRAFVFSGANGALILRLESYRYRFGYALAGVDDVNGDGVPDIAVSAPFIMRNLGGVYLFSGDDGSLLWESVEPSPAWDDNQPMASFGMFLAATNDIDGDGSGDLLVGAPFHSYGINESESVAGGRAFVLSGVDGAIIRAHDNPTPSYNDYFGAGPSAIGDQDEDGVDDYCFAESRSGLVHIYSGASGSEITAVLSPYDGNPDLFGFQTARAGDKNWDGVEDFWIAAPDDGFLSEPDGGVVYAMNASSDVLIEIEDPTPDVLADQLGFGWRMRSTADLDGDGEPDLMVSKPAESLGGLSNAGAVYLILNARANRPPVADAGSDQILYAGLGCNSIVTLEGHNSTDPDSAPGTNDEIVSFDWYEGDTLLGSGETLNYTFSLGVHTVKLVVTDNAGETDEDEVIITVQDSMLPEISVAVNPDRLWPPNHKMVWVSARDRKSVV